MDAVQLARLVVDYMQAMEGFDMAKVYSCRAKLKAAASAVLLEDESKANTETAKG